MNLKEIVRPNIWNLRSYSSARNEFKGDASVWLDANENPYNEPYNRYPDPLQQKVKDSIAQIRDVSPHNIFLGVGSDECIDLAYRVFCEPAKDNVVAISPTYGMYEVCADINNVEYRKVALDENFDFRPADLLDAADDNTKIIWLCSPNNPSGNAFDIEKIKFVCRNFKNIVVIDEAYIDFSEKGSMIGFLDDLPNIIVMQTFSKAWGSASVRLGMAFAGEDIISLYNKVKYPYNINLLTQKYALDMLARHGEIIDWVAKLLVNRDILSDAVKGLKYVQRVYPSDANFLLLKVDDADDLYDFLCKKGIVVRNRNKVEKCLGCIRITVGESSENEELLVALKEYEAD